MVCIDCIFTWILLIAILTQSCLQTDVSRLPLYVANLFTPRPPQPYLRPVDVPPEQRSNARISGVSQYLEQLRAEKENDEYTPTESWLQKQEREKKEKAARNAQQLKEETKKCKCGFSCVF